MEDYKNKKTAQHESFGMVSLSRTYTGQGPYFFGTDMRPNSYITMKIVKNCELTYDDIMGRRPSASGKYKDVVAEVMMTSTQFADMITSIGMGDGTPCTVIKDSGERVAQFDDSVQGVFEYEYENAINQIKSLEQLHKSAEDDIKKIIDKLPKKKQEEITRILSNLRQSVSSNIPYHLRRVASAAEQITSRAKGEIASYVTLAKNMAPRMIDSHTTENGTYMLDHEFSGESPVNPINE